MMAYVFDTQHTYMYIHTHHYDKGFTWNKNTVFENDNHSLEPAHQALKNTERVTPHAGKCLSHSWLTTSGTQ